MYSPHALCTLLNKSLSPIILGMCVFPLGAKCNKEMTINLCIKWEDVKIREVISLHLAKSAVWDAKSNFPYSESFLCDFALWN